MVCARARIQKYVVRACPSRARAPSPSTQLKMRNNLCIRCVIKLILIYTSLQNIAKFIRCKFRAGEMYNIFTPFVLTLIFFNNGARWMGETFLPLYFYNTERIFIPPLQSSVRFSDVWPLADMVTYPELDVDQELIYSALEFAQNVPDFKTCFPEIWNDIVDVCSRDSTFISEYQYTVVALRIFNCLHHRSLGIEEIDFEFIDQDYVAYLAVMTAKERVLYQKMYNVARGLCLNEKQDRTIRDVRRRAENIENAVARYLNRVRRIKTHLATSTKVNTKKTNIKQGVHGTFINETGRSLKEFKQNSAEKFKKYIRVMKNVVDESNSCSKSVDTSLDLVAKNFRKIGLILQGEKSLKRSWINFAQEYSRKTTEMEGKVASIETKLGKILKYKLK